MIGLGDLVQDRITGFKGIVIARTEWLFGCVRITVQPQKLDKGKRLDSDSFDEANLKVIKRRAVLDPNEVAVPTDGGDRDDSVALRR